MRRLWLGLFLIAAASSVLLISDLQQRKPSGGSIPRIAIFQHASQGVIDEGVAGMLAILSESGYIDGQTAEIHRFNAENDIATANSIAKQLTSDEYDLILTATTLSMQTLANANQTTKKRHIFGLVSDPAGSGVGISATDPLSHPPYMAGIGTMQPVKETFELAKQIYPGLKRIGVSWNPAEANSRANVVLARTMAQELGLEVVEATIDNSSGVFEASNSLVARGAQALWVGGDVTVLVAMDSVVGAAKRGRIPVFTSVPGNAQKGALFDVGANYTEVGRITGGLGVEVLKGRDPATIPVRNVVPEKLILNTTALEGLKDPWRIPPDLLAKADTVIDSSGTREKESSSTRPLTKKWNIQIVELNNVLDVEEAEAGVFKGFEEAGLVRDRDFEATVRNAQGDMATLNGLIDASLAAGADLLFPLSTPALQASMQRVQGRVPVVFSYVSDGVVAGAGKTNEDHLPYLTGTNMVAPYPQMLALLKQCLPGVKRIGTLFVPAEVNMVFNKDQLVEDARKVGIEVIAVGVSTSSEVSDAALALMSRNLDALVQIPGNMTSASFTGIARAAATRRVPVFAFQGSQKQQGASVIMARDYFDAGRESALMAARVMRGEDPGKIPFKAVSQTKLIVNPEAARAVGMIIPQSVIDKAVEVVTANPAQEQTGKE